ncbi:head-tail connector protein [Aneurinibacillus aneurinilyticus]|uniref:Phage DNA packaging protein n=1 Tax=Aneurinibacillus aneurinilyticus ATCC 12856 TaxID=649747 RepID=U1YFN6_ANEAE|nr:head-tail connector protein [Aneurinibacillus aneurinilyticus]ERI10897.1 phage DNA packaging protein [Aneurinibacillus aneurinilyticus ATCC 12856]MED0704945.1 head-tail connector protein [Aneurinibacillus aneurinilyticus]MED0723085.1 head-tail connector protein [Aneurinibacillus aneurinilyticus]MED0731466.1 head-tail connector protein [Aneurinibacillus aneurinilyticus]MED0740089.1 head-tail connector protein [Aneurinibacillus aneurinilyticus]
MTEIFLEELKGYLRIDGSEDDMVLALLVEAAREYLADAGVKDDTTSRYKLAIMLYVALHYENRDPSIKIEKFNFALESIILQLK